MKYFKNNKEIYAYDEEQILQGYGSDMVEITLEEVNAINQAKQEEAFNSLSYAQKRASEYPPITDYIDGIVKGDTVQVQEYIDKCLAVKAKYPKGVINGN